MGGTSMSRILTAALFVLAFSAPASAGTLPEGVKLFAYPPVGNGDPNAVSCWAYRRTPPVRGLQCARNSYWARRNGRSAFASDSGSQMIPDNGLPGSVSVGGFSGAR